MVASDEPSQAEEFELLPLFSQSGGITKIAERLAQARPSRQDPAARTQQPGCRVIHRPIQSASKRTEKLHFSSFPVRFLHPAQL